jgi:hypothetical protein
MQLTLSRILREDEAAFFCIFKEALLYWPIVKRALIKNAIK